MILLFIIEGQENLALYLSINFFISVYAQLWELTNQVTLPDVCVQPTSDNYMRLSSQQ